MYPGDEIEVLRPELPRGRFRSVLFDFDGTLSLIREGWPQVMIPMMVEVLRQTGTAESGVARSWKNRRRKSRRALAALSSFKTASPLLNASSKTQPPQEWYDN